MSHFRDMSEMFNKYLVFLMTILMSEPCGRRPKNPWVSLPWFYPPVNIKR